MIILFYRERRINIKLRVSNFTQQYEGMPIIEDISFYLQEDDFVTFSGPRGCGKSTIFKMFQALCLLIREKYP